MADPIQSTKNPLVRRFRAAALGEAPGLMVAEGRRLVGEALDANLAVVEVAHSPRLLTHHGGAELLRRLVERVATVHPCNDAVLARLSQLETHQGVSVILRRPAARLADLFGGDGRPALVLVAAGVRDPGNLGALVRSAEAARATGLIATAGSADPFRDKALRGSAGSAFRLPILAGLEPGTCATQLLAAGLQLLVADRSGTRSLWDVDLCRPTALVLGSEGGGVPDALVAAAQASVSIPLAPQVDSLNVAVAAGILLFEAGRQRRFEAGRQRR